MCVRGLMGLVLALALIGSACGGDGENSKGEGDNGLAATETPAELGETPMREETPEEPATGDDTEEDGGETPTPAEVEGDGTVTLGEETYAFDVESCELDSAGTEIDIRGEGPGPDGRPFTVRVSRQGKIDSIQVRFSEGLDVFVAATGTSDALGGEAPSLEVDGRTVSATATFFTPEEQERGPEATGVEGSILVNCP